jgi:hypothetical protein
MLKTATIGAMAALGAFAAVLIGGRTSSTAADEVRCRVNVEAFLTDWKALTGPGSDFGVEEIKKLLKPKP